MTCWIEYCNDSILIESSFTFVRSNIQILKDESADAVKGHWLERKLMSASVEKETKCPESFVSTVFGRTDRKTPDRNTVQQIDSGKDMERFVPTSELKKELFLVFTLLKNQEYVRMCIFTYIQYYEREFYVTGPCYVRLSKC